MDWIQQHWEGLLLALGAGGGSSVGVKKILDIEQNKRIEKLESKVSRIDSDLKVNSEADKQFKEAINMQLSDIRKSQETIINHLLNNK